MQINRTQKVPAVLIFLVVLVLVGCQPAAAPAEPETENASLATARVSAQQIEPGRATILAHNDLQYVVAESPSPDSLDQVDALLAAQSTCAVFVAEKAAQELDVALTGATATASFNQEAQRVRVFLDLPGVDDDAVLALANNLRQRCPIYTTLARAQSVDFNPGERFQMTAGDTAAVSATLTEFGQADVNAQEQTFVMDSVPPLDGPNLELNPLDLMLGGLAGCAAFAVDDIEPLGQANVVVEGDFDPSGVRDLEGENPRIQALRIVVETEADAENLAEEAEAQIAEECLLYQSLNGTVTINVSTQSAN